MNFRQGQAENMREFRRGNMVQPRPSGGELPRIPAG